MPSTTNYVPTALSMCLKIAVEWGVIATLPCRIRLLPIQKGVHRFYEFDKYDFTV